MVTIRRSAMKPRRSPKVVAEGLQAARPARVVLAQVLQHLLRRAVRARASAPPGELALVPAEIGPPDLSKPLQGDVHHLSTSSFLR